jgi:hypothetical protein
VLLLSLRQVQPAAPVEGVNGGAHHLQDDDGNNSDSDSDGEAEHQEPYDDQIDSDSDAEPEEHADAAQLPDDPAAIAQVSAALIL